MTNHALNNDFVTGDGELFGLILDFNNDGFSPLLVLDLVKLHALELGLDDILNDVLDLGWVESLVLTGLHSIGWHVSHAAGCKVHFLVSCD